MLIAAAELQSGDLTSSSLLQLARRTKHPATPSWVLTSRARPAPPPPLCFFDGGMTDWEDKAGRAKVYLGMWAVP